MDVFLKNRKIAPGLSLVAWGDFDSRIILLKDKFLSNFRKEFEGCVIWYENIQLHLTLAPLIRTQYDRKIKLTKSNINLDLVSMCTELKKVPPFQVCLDQVNLDKDGQFSIKAQLTDSESEEHYSNLINIINFYSKADFELNSTEMAKTLHINFGYFYNWPNSKAKFSLQEFTFEPIYVYTDLLSLVHYMKRTLEFKYIEGYYNFRLGSNNEKVNEKELFTKLGLI